MGTYQFNGPTKDSPSQSTSNSSSAKYRIYQVFESEIMLDELSLPSNPPPSEEESAGQIESVASLQHPLIKINDYILNDVEIRKMVINSTGFVPEIMLKVEFIHQTFLTKELPKDGDIISVAIKNKNNILKLIRADFVITGVQSGENTTQAVGPVTMIFYGSLFIPWLLNGTYSFSHEGTSFEAFKALAKKLQLGFATNEDNTNDKQVWISSHTPLSNFINDTIQCSYKDDESFYKAWIDIYYNLNFVNVNKQLMSSEDEVDTGALLNNIDKDYTYGEKTDESEVIESPKVFSNYDAFRTSSFYIITWKPINRSTQITYEVGTKVLCNMFEHNEKLFKTADSKKYWNIPLEPTYDPAKLNQYILLRGRATQNPDMKGKDLTKANYSFPEINEYNAWTGIQYTISNPDDDNLQWDGNHHSNYQKARVQNLINNKELDKLNLLITVNGMNANLIKGDKVPVVLVKKDPVENQLVSPESAGSDLLEQFYSGWFYVKGFNIIYDKENAGSVMSNFRQEFILTRREWPPPVPVEPIPQNENNI